MKELNKDSYTSSHRQKKVMHQMQPLEADIFKIFVGGTMTPDHHPPTPPPPPPLTEPRWSA